MKRRKHGIGDHLLLLCLLVFAGMGLVPAYGEVSHPSDAASIRRRMDKMIAFLDSPVYARAVSWEEHIVLTYRLARGRLPKPLEFFLLMSLREDIGMTRSAALSVALRGKEARTTWAHCRSFLNRVDISDFFAGQNIKDNARLLAKTPRSHLLEQLKKGRTNSRKGQSRKEGLAAQTVPNIHYNTYFGYLHAHSALSDGQGSAMEAYAFARDQGGLDFFALTDHGELLLIWPWDNKWASLVDAAEAMYDPGSYVTLWGFEWSNPFLGHINVLNTADFTDTVSTFWLPSLYDWIRDRPEALGRFNHPGDSEIRLLEFFFLIPYVDVIPQMVGIETWNKGRSFDTYYYSGSWFTELSYWDMGNLQGWRLGALGGQDNHNADWGTRNDFRTAVLAEDLTREAIIAAYLNRRFYATEDKDLSLDFRSQGYPMGSQLFDVPRHFEVSACDEGGDTFEEVRLYRNGALLQVQAVTGSCIQVFFADPTPTGSDYYYVIVKQNDDNDGNGRNDEAISSPIWIN